MVKMKFSVGCFSVFLHLCCTFLTAFGYEPKNPIVTTKYGPVVGLLQTSRSERNYSSYRGIPYAAPPIGELRFKAPVPPKLWSFAINATKDAPFCIQKNYFFARPEVEGKEDCLYLNVYVPETTTRPVFLPVMVFIHWGGFFAGRGSSDYIGPEYFMDKDIILVTFNYRLGVFGFFTTLDDSAPGNFGMKDQVMALKFVQDNIQYFGGNPNKVTIFGQSAGGGSVDLHMISPSSKGLFQQAISQSGVALNLWAKPLNVLQPIVIATLANVVNCSDNIDNKEHLVKCLRKVDAIDLAQSADKFKYFSTEPLNPYSLVTEEKTLANPDPFLTKEPLEYLQSGEFQKIPWIVGNAQDEGILRVSAFTRSADILEQLNANFSDLLPKLLGLQLSVGPDFSSLYNNLTDFYLGDKKFINKEDSSSVQGFIDLYSDRSFVYGTFQSVILKSQKDHKPIWLYNFDYRGQYTYGDKFAATVDKINFTWGVSHCDDLLYLFKSPALFPDLKQKTDLRMSESLIKFWTNFAIYGEPDPDQTVKWTSLKFDSVNDIKNINLKFLNITGSHDKDNIEFKVQNGWHFDRMTFWINQNVLENFPGLS